MNAVTFWARLDTSAGPDACWLWTGAKRGKGYGSLRWKDGHQRAHRVAYELAHGTCHDLHVLHRCDAPACCNPAHLFLGTNADNMADRNAKGRQARGDRNGTRTKPESRPRGEQNHQVTLTDAALLQALLDVAAGEGLRSVARRLGVSHSTLRNARDGRSRKSVTAELRFFLSEMPAQKASTTRTTVVGWASPGAR
jgi:hypothetical protein